MTLRHRHDSAALVMLSWFVHHIFNWHQKWKARYPFTLVANFHSLNFVIVWDIPIWNFYTCYILMDQLIVMVAEFYPMLLPISCHLDMFPRKNLIFSFSNNSRRLQAVIRYVKIYYSLTVLGYFRPGKVKNHFRVRVNFYVDSEIWEICHCVLNEKNLTQMLCFYYPLWGLKIYIPEKNEACQVKDRLHITITSVYYSLLQDLV